MTGVLFHPTAADVVYARTGLGGAFRWDASGARWIPLVDNIQSERIPGRSVLSLAVDPHDSERLYLACGLWADVHNAVLLRSVDRGTTWSRTNLPFGLGGIQTGNVAGERLQVDPRNGSILFLGTSYSGLWKSSDYGVTWAKVEGFQRNNVTCVTFVPSGADTNAATATLYAGTSDFLYGHLYKSVDGGVNWTELSVNSTPYQIVADRQGNVFTSLVNGFLDIFSPDPTASLSKISASSPNVIKINPTINGVICGIGVDQKNPSTLIAAKANQRFEAGLIFRSIDQGASWQTILTGNTVDYSSAPWAGSLDVETVTDVDIDPFRPGHVLVATTHGIFGTDNATAVDAGQVPSWSFRSTGLENSFVYEIISPPAGAPLVSALPDIDGFRHDDLTVSPTRGKHTPKLNGAQFLDFAENAPNVMVRAGTMAAQYSTDGAMSWTSFPDFAPLSNDWGSVAVSADGKRFFRVSPRNGAHYSDDKGVSWTDSPGIVGSVGFVPICICDRVNPRKVYIEQTASGILYLSADGGATFSASPTTLPYASYTIRATPGFEGHLWLPAGDGLYQSTDSGKTFNHLSSVQTAHAVGFGRAAPGNSYPAIYISGTVGGIFGLFRSDNMGINWIRLNDDQHQYGVVSSVSGDPRTYGRVYVATAGRGIIYGDTTDVPSSLPSITTQPTSQSAAVGSTVQFIVSASGANSYQWYKDGAAISGSVGNSLTLLNLQAGDAGQYSVVVTGAGGQITSNIAVLSIASAESQKLINISTRSFVGSGGDVLIAGFIIGGTQSKRVILRASGPALIPFGVGAVLSDPVLTLYDGGSKKMLENDDWSVGDGDLVEGTAAQVNAFAWPRGSKDAAIVTTLLPGAYTAIVSGKNGAQGIALVELYEADQTPTAAKFINISSRAMVKDGGEILIGGFIIGGDVAKRVLIRAWGPALAPAPFSVAGVLSDPVLKLYAGQTEINQNDNWGADPTLKQAFKDTGAYAWADGSKDAAMIVTLNPGAYTAQVTGKAGDRGVALLEIFEYP